MCGIVAAAAGSNIVNVLIEGLKKLEYRGYDSAGLAVIGRHGIERVRAVGRVAELEKAAATTEAQTGIAHTRWATHGAPCERNAHPHVSGQIAVVHNGIIENHEALRIANANGESVQRPVHVSELSAAAVELGEYQHYMQKEIFEQPQALGNTLEMIGGSKSIQPGIFGAEAANTLADIDSILILACGTSSHAGLTARYWLESIAGVPCNVEIASEYRYRVSVPNPRQLIVAISQSGETADTLAALQYAKASGQSKTLAICNVPESAIVRECALRFITRAGPEIGVASTKAFTTQLAALFLLTLVVAKVKGQLTETDEARYLDELRHLPVAVNKVLSLETGIAAWAARFANKADALFLGRGRHYPIALEGALKLNQIEASDGIHVMKLPEHYGQLSPILHVVSLQLLSYHAALVKGTDVDKPRNLAKSVTVE